MNPDHLSCHREVPLGIAPLINVEILKNVKSLMLSRAINASDPDGPSVTSLYTIAGFDRFDDTSLTFHTTVGDQIVIADDMAVVVRNDVVYPACSSDVSCSSFTTDTPIDVEAKQLRLEQLLSEEDEGTRRRLRKTSTGKRSNPERTKTEKVPAKKDKDKAQAFPKSAQRKPKRKPPTQRELEKVGVRPVADREKPIDKNKEGPCKLKTKPGKVPEKRVRLAEIINHGKPTSSTPATVGCGEDDSVQRKPKIKPEAIPITSFVEKASCPSKCKSLLWESDKCQAAKWPRDVIAGAKGYGANRDESCHSFLCKPHAECVACDFCDFTEPPTKPPPKPTGKQIIKEAEERVPAIKPIREEKGPSKGKPAPIPDDPPEPATPPEPVAVCLPEMDPNEKEWQDKCYPNAPSWACPLTTYFAGCEWWETFFISWLSEYARFLPDCVLELPIYML
jgi:hypothetical protein